MKHLFSLRGNRKPFYGLLSVVFLSLFMLSAVVFVGCDNNAPLAVDDQSDLEQQGQQTEPLQTITMNLEKAKVNFEGKLYEKDEFQKVLNSPASLIIVAGTGLPETDVVYAFGSETTFNAWAKTTKFADKFAQLLQETPDVGLEKTLGPGGWAKLYDGNLSGTNKLYYSPTNKSTLGTFDNKTSSVDVYAGSSKTSCALYQNTYYGGRWLILTAYAPWLVRFDQSVLTAYSFNNITSSVKVY